MECCPKEVLDILPVPMQNRLSQIRDAPAQELRLRRGQNIVVKFYNRYREIPCEVTKEDLEKILHLASRFSPWNAQSLRQGYLTAPGGHRIGVCGVTAGEGMNFQTVDSICIRICRDVSGVSKGLESLIGSILILGAPGWGKSTLLRDLAREIASCHAVSVADEREELFPAGIRRGRFMDVLSRCPKEKAVIQLLKTMGPEYVAMDEITSAEDVKAVMACFGCGVQLIATAHAATLEEFCARPIYRELIQNRVFQSLVLLHKDQSFEIGALA